MKDAHEFLCQVLDQLKDDIDKKNKEEANWKMQCLKGKLTTEKTEKEIVEEEKEKELSSDGSDAAAATAAAFAIPLPPTPAASTATSTRSFNRQPEHIHRFI